MGWEMRGRWGPYYTISRREGGRVIREYVGKGPEAELLSTLRETRSFAEFRLRLERKQELALLQQRPDVEQALLEFGSLLNMAAREALEAAGYHQHKRGEWRKKRGTKDEGPAGAHRLGDGEPSPTG